MTMQQTPVQKPVEKEIETVIRILKTTPGVAAIYLFGSCATGKATPVSDIDICIIAKGMTSAARAEIAAMASERLDISFFDKLPINIQMRVFKEGRPVFVADERFVKETVIRTIRLYLDFRPLMRRYYAKAHGIEI